MSAVPSSQASAKALTRNHYFKEWFDMYSEAENALSFIKITYAKGQSNIMSFVLGGFGEGGERVVLKSFKLPLKFPLAST